MSKFVLAAHISRFFFVSFCVEVCLYLFVCWLHPTFDQKKTNFLDKHFAWTNLTYLFAKFLWMCVVSCRLVNRFVCVHFLYSKWAKINTFRFRVQVNPMNFFLSKTRNTQIAVFIEMKVERKVNNFFFGLFQNDGNSNIQTLKTYHKNMTDSDNFVLKKKNLILQENCFAWTWWVM